MKSLYISPTMRVVHINIHKMMALSASEQGIGNGGSVSKLGCTPDPDVKEISDVDIWEEEW